jgi:hypothetical protein
VPATPSGTRSPEVRSAWTQERTAGFYPDTGPVRGAWIANAGDGYQPYTSAAMEKFYPLIEQHGYLIVLFGVTFGTAGIPFPSAAILLAAGVLVQQGHLALRDAIVFGILGAIIGNQIGYWVGQKGDDRSS